jgi:hypothetical protein
MSLPAASVHFARKVAIALAETDSDGSLFLTPAPGDSNSPAFLGRPGLSC